MAKSKNTEEFEDQNDYSKKILSNRKDLLDLEDTITNNLKLQKSYTEKLNQLTNDIKATKASGKKVDKEIAANLFKQYNVSKELLKIANNELITQKEKIKEETKFYKLLKLRNITVKQFQKYQDEYAASLKGQLSIFDTIEEKLNEIPIVGGIVSKALGLDNIKEELEEKLSKNFKKNLLSNLKEGNSLSSGLGESFAIAGQSANAIYKGLAPILPLIIGIVAAFKLAELVVEVNKELTAMARSLGVSTEEAHKLHEEMAKNTTESDNALMTMSNQAKAASALGAELGVNNGLTKELIETQVSLTNNIGLATDDAAMLNANFILNGQSAEEMSTEMIGVVNQIKEASGASLNLKDVLTAVAKTSVTIVGSFKGDAKALVSAVVKAKMLGTTLDKIKEIGINTLDIETSVGKEMEARVITGKNINLNGYRAATLAKDQNKMADELAKNVGTFDEFNKMDYLQQKALADTFGLQSDELGNMLKQREILKKLGVESLSRATEETINNSTLAPELKKQVLEQKKQSDISEKLAKAAESIKESFAGLAGALQPVIEIFGDIVKHTTLIQTIIASLAGYYVGSLITGAVKWLATTAEQFGMLTLITGEKTAQAIADTTSSTAITESAAATAAAVGPQTVLTGEKTAEAGAALLAVSAETLGLAIPLVLAAAAGGMMLLSEMTSTKDGVISPDGGLVVSGPKGSISLDKDDSIIAGTNLGGNSDSSNNGDLLTELRKQNELLKAILTATDQPVKINIGSKTIEELDSQISLRKNYNLSADRTYGNRL